MSVCKLLGFGARTAALATDVFDRYGASAPAPESAAGEPITRLVGFVALVLASKMEEPRPLLPSQVHDALGGIFSTADACAAERCIARRLSFDFDPALCEDFVCHILPLLGPAAVGAPARCGGGGGMSPTALQAASSSCPRIGGHGVFTVVGDQVSAWALARLSRRVEHLICLARPDPAFLTQASADMAAGAILSASCMLWPPAGGAAFARRRDAFLLRCAELGIDDAAAVMACAAFTDGLAAQRAAEAQAVAEATAAQAVAAAQAAATTAAPPPRGIQAIITDVPTEILEEDEEMAAAAASGRICRRCKHGGRRSPNSVADVSFTWDDATVAALSGSGAGCHVCRGTDVAGAAGAAGANDCVMRGTPESFPLGGYDGPPVAERSPPNAMAYSPVCFSVGPVTGPVAAPSQGGVGGGGVVYAKRSTSRPATAVAVPLQAAKRARAGPEVWRRSY